MATTIYPPADWQGIHIASVAATVDGTPSEDLPGGVPEGRHHVEIRVGLFLSETGERLVCGHRSIVKLRESSTLFAAVRLRDQGSIGRLRDRIKCVFKLGAATGPSPGKTDEPSKVDWGAERARFEATALHRVAPVPPPEVVARGEAQLNSMLICVNEDGGVDYITLVVPSDPAWDGATIDAMVRWRFQPPSEAQSGRRACYSRDNKLTAKHD